MKDAGKGTATYYRFQDASGRVHLVDSIDSVPQALRAGAARIEYSDETQAPTRDLFLSAVGRTGLAGWQLFGLGFIAALIAMFAVRRLPGTLRFVLRLSIVVGLVALLASAYFGWTRREAQQSTDALAGPGALMDDAKNAVSKLNARMAAEQAELKEIERAK